MLNTKQRDTVERISVNLLTLVAGTLVIGSAAAAGGFKILPFVIGLAFGGIFLWAALWVHRSKKGE